jgi:hypothetical protein
LETTPARLALAVERARVGIISVGEGEREVVERLAQRTPVVARGLAAQILAAAAAREGTKDRGPPRVARPGEDAWWDEKWKSPYSLRAGDPTRARDALLIEPLQEASWSPHLTRGVLYYALWTSPALRDRTWPAFRRPEIELVVADDIRGLHYEELVDELRDLWGEGRIRLPEGRAVAAPVTPLRITYRVSRVVFWIALAGALLLGRPNGAPSQIAVIAAGIAVVAVFVRRVAGARMQVERPRRRAAR